MGLAPLPTWFPLVPSIRPLIPVPSPIRLYAPLTVPPTSGEPPATFPATRLPVTVVVPESKSKMPPPPPSLPSLPLFAPSPPLPPELVELPVIVLWLIVSKPPLAKTPPPLPPQPPSSSYTT